MLASMTDISSGSRNKQAALERAQEGLLSIAPHAHALVSQESGGAGVLRRSVHIDKQV
jgi:hypothetical protein